MLEFIIVLLIICALVAAVFGRGAAQGLFWTVIGIVVVIVVLIGGLIAFVSSQAH